MLNHFHNSVYTNKKLSNPSYVCTLYSCPTLEKSAVQPKTTSLCSSITVITLWWKARVQLRLRLSDLPKNFHTQKLNLNNITTSGLLKQNTDNDFLKCSFKYHLMKSKFFLMFFYKHLVILLNVFCSIEKLSARAIRVQYFNKNRIRL